MKVEYLRYSNKYINSIIRYYIGTPKIYRYCYKNCTEFRDFIDNSNDERKKTIRSLHRSYRMVHCRDPLVFIGTCGIAFLIKKIGDLIEYKKVNKTIQGDEFKTLFGNFDEVLRNNGLEWYPNNC